ncbi:MAG: hypothetical protein R6V13_12390 [Anaerolineae bacterium]
MTNEQRQRAHEETHQAWKRNAAYWDGRFSEIPPIVVARMRL